MLKRKKQKPEYLIQFGRLLWERQTEYKIEFKELFTIAKECDVEIVDFTFYDGEVVSENYQYQHSVWFSVKGSLRNLEKFWNCILESKLLDFFQL